MKGTAQLRSHSYELDDVDEVESELQDEVWERDMANFEQEPSQSCEADMMCLTTSDRLEAAR